MGLCPEKQPNSRSRLVFSSVAFRNCLPFKRTWALSCDNLLVTPLAHHGISSYGFSKNVSPATPKNDNAKFLASYCLSVLVYSWSPLCLFVIWIWDTQTLKRDIKEEREGGRTEKCMALRRAALQPRQAWIGTTGAWPNSLYKATMSRQRGTAKKKEETVRWKTAWVWKMRAGQKFGR